MTWWNDLLDVWLTFNDTFSTLKLRHVYAKNMYPISHCCCPWLKPERKAIEQIFIVF